MSKKIDKLIKRLQKAKELLAKDALDEKIKAKISAKLSDRDIADHMRDIDETIPAKQRANIKNSIKAQRAKTEAPKIKAPEAPKPKLTVIKSASEVADELIKSLSQLAGAKPIKKFEDNRPMTGNYGDRTFQDFKPKAAAPVKKQELDCEENTMDKSEKDHKAKIKAMITAAKAKKQQVEKSLPEWNEDEMAKALAGVAPLNRPSLQPSNKEFEQAALNSGMAVTQAQHDELNKNWGNTMNNWLAEATKPISSRFSSQEEEDAYWASIKVNSGPDNGPGY